MPITSATRGSSTTCWMRGVYLPPSGYELWTLCTALGPDEIDHILDAARTFRDRPNAPDDATGRSPSRSPRCWPSPQARVSPRRPIPGRPTPSPMAPSASRVPTWGPPCASAQVGTTKRGVDPAVAGISGLGVSVTERDGAARIAWAVGDRSANEIAGPDAVVLFALDARNGSVVERFGVDPSTLEPGPDGDPVTNADQTDAALPDMEDLAIEPAPSQRIWLFDTGDNDGTRTNLNVYVVDEPSIGGGEAREVEPTRFPIQVVASEGPQAANVEGAFVDPASDEAPTTVYLIPKFPVDLDGDGAATDFRVFSFAPDPDGRRRDRHRRGHRGRPPHAGRPGAADHRRLGQPGRKGVRGACRERRGAGPTEPGRGGPVEPRCVRTRSAR